MPFTIEPRFAGSINQLNTEKILSMTKFKKGHDPRRNTAGRPKGSQNKTSEDLRQMAVDFLAKNWNSVQSDFNKLAPVQKLNFIEKLLRLTVPAPINELERLSDEQINELINKLKKGEL